MNDIWKLIVGRLKERKRRSRQVLLSVPLRLNRPTFLLLLLISPTCWALSSDKQQIAYAQADSVLINHKTGINVYQGHVKFTQGTTIITGDTITTYSHGNQLQKAIAIGKPASYGTMPDNSKLFFTSVGNTIKYYPLKARVEFIGDAKATQGKDNFAGPMINYDMKTQIVTTPLTAKGKTFIVIQPDQK